MPNPLESERQLLGALLFAPERIHDAGKLVESGDFAVPNHRALFSCIRELTDAGHPIDFASVGNRLKAKRDDVAWQAEVLDLAQTLHGQTTTATFIPYHAKIVAEAACLRSLEAHGRRVMDQAAGAVPGQEEGGAADLLEKADQAILALRKKARVTTVHSAVESGAALLESMSRVDGRSVSTGIEDLDRILGGLIAGEMTIIGARPGLGKTMLALQVALNLARAGKSVVFFSAEMRHTELAKRLMCNIADVSNSDVRANSLSRSDASDMRSALDALRAMRFTIDDAPGVTLSAVRSTCAATQMRDGLDLIVVDYLQLMRHPGTESRRVEVEECSRGLKEFAKSFDVPVLCLAQLSRAVESREDGVPRLSDLRETGAIEQDADVVGFLHATEAERSNGSLWFKVAKHRDGQVQSTQLVVDASVFRITGRPTIGLGRPPTMEF